MSRFGLFLLTLFFTTLSLAQTTFEQNDYQPLQQQKAEQFLRGFQIEDFVPEAYDCVTYYYDLKRQANYTALKHGLDLDAAASALNQTAQSGDTGEAADLTFHVDNYTDFLLNVTALISQNGSLTFESCGISAYNTMIETKDYLRIFKRDRHVYSYTASALQSMLSNVLLLQDLNDRLVLAIEANNTVEQAWLTGRTMRILLVVPPLEKIEDYDYNADNDDFNLRLRQEQALYWQNVQDLFTGFTNATLGAQYNNTDSQSCWLLALEISIKGSLLPMGYINKDYPKMIHTVTTMLRLLYPICLNCLDVQAQYAQLFSSYIDTLSNEPDKIIYNVAYHMGSIYEDVMYLMGEDIFGDDLQPLDELEERDRYTQIGKHSGDVFVEIFGDTGGYDYPLVTIDYPEEFGWALDNTIDLGVNEL